MSRGAATKRVLLVGAGHAHLHVIAASRRFIDAGHQVTVVAPGNFWYSGMATGMLGGAYDPADDQVDIQALALANGARFVRAAVTGFDIPGRSITLRGGEVLGFDLVSLNLGSFPPEISGEGQPGCYRVKPIVELARLREDLLSRFRQGGRPVRVLVAGGGATGAELAANIEGLARRRRAAIELSVVTGRGGLLKQLPAGAAQKVEKVLTGRGIRIIREVRVSRIADSSAHLENGATLPFDLFLNAAGLKPAPLLAQTGLPLDPHGALELDQHLRSPADPAVHGAGDCVAVQGYELPKVGVYAIRQAPVLLGNLLADAEGLPPAAFDPQRRYLWIMNLGDGTGLAMRGGLWWHGRSAFWLKNRIDRRFMDLYRT